MDFDSSTKFVASLAKFLQSLCNGYVDFNKGVEVIGHIHINVDSDLGKKVDYVLNERVCKNDNSITFISNSFPAQPAVKPAPLPPKPPESDKNESEQSVVMSESGQMVPHSTNVGTLGSYRNAASRSNDGVYSPGTKRPRSPNQRRGMGFKSNHGMPQSPRYQDSSGPSAKMGRRDGFEADGGDEDDYSNYGDPSEVDQKPVIDPDISIVKEELMASQQEQQSETQYSGGPHYSGAPQYSGGPQYSGPGRGRPQVAPQYPSQSPMNPNLSNFSGAIQQQQPDTYTGGSSFDGGPDPSTLTQEQQEELEMYYRKGTDQHLTFLRNMREAHAMYPFTGKRDKELFEKALAEMLLRIPLLRFNQNRLAAILTKNGHQRKINARNRGQFKSPGGRGGGKLQFRQQAYYQQQPYAGSYPGTPVHPGGMERRMSAAGSEGGDSFLQGPGDESYGYPQEDSRDTQHSSAGGNGDMSQSQASGFHGVLSAAIKAEGQQQQTGVGDTADPPDIKPELPPIPFMSGSEFELIEIDEDDDDI